MAVTSTSAPRSSIGGLSPQRQAALARLLPPRAKAPIPRVPRDGELLPCSYEQRQMWHQLDGTAPNATLGLRLDGTLDLAALSTALDGVLARHESAAYVPMDPAFPARRIADMLKTAETRLVVTEAAYADLFTSVEVLDIADPSIETQPATPPGVPYDLDRLAYLIFTSGSTGRPKGVQVTHRGLLNHVWWAVQELASKGSSGAPLMDMRMYVLDPAGKLVPGGVSGELYVGGTGVTRGYVNRPDLTAERADEFAKIVTTVHRSLDGPHEAGTWRKEAVSREAPPADARLGRFLRVAGGQMVSMIGTATTEFAVPIWAYLQTGSLPQFSLFAIIGLVPGLVLSPVIGALVDRNDRRLAMLAGDGACLALQAVLLALLLTGNLSMPALYGILTLLSISLTVQRLAWSSAVPQLAPKHYLGHAGGVLQLGNAIGRLMVPLFAVGVLAAIGLDGILIANVACYVVAVTVTLLTPFPKRLAWTRRESVGAEIRNGFRYLWRRRGLRAMALTMFAVNFFLFTAFVMISPLVLSIGDLADTGRIAVIAGLGAGAGGFAISLWGGPKRRRMFGMLASVGVVAAFAFAMGLRPSLALIAVCAAGMALMMSIGDGIWITIIHAKVPQRYHARVISINQMLAMSTQPIGLAVQAWAAGLVFEPLLREGGALAPTVGALIGVGEGRGIGLLYLICGLAMAVTIVIALRHPALAHFDRDTPDAEPDDLAGLAELTAKRTAADSPAERILA